MESWKYYEPQTVVRCIRLAFQTIPERDCWKRLLKDAGFFVIKATTKEVCYEEDPEQYPEEIAEIDCDCSGCQIYH